jgi:hexokinase
MYAHNASTLLASKRRAVYYPPTGTGRDSYIMTDNGGTNIKYTCQGVPELGNYMKFGP